MIEIKVTQSSLSVRGHALTEEGELTHSRACAASTMLAFTLADAVDEYLASEYPEETRIQAYAKPGRMSVRWTADDRTDAILRTVRCGFRRLAKEYPNHVRLEDIT